MTNISDPLDRTYPPDKLFDPRTTGTIKTDGQDHRTPTATYIKLRNAILQATKNHKQYGQQEHGIYYPKLLQQKTSLLYNNALNNTYNIDDSRTWKSVALNATQLGALQTHHRLASRYMSYFIFNNCT